MDMIRAREILWTLANGVNPTTGEVLPAESVYNAPEVIRALFVILEATAPPQQQDPLRNAGKPWNDMEDDKLRDEFSAGVKLSHIAQEHGRSRGAIESRLEHLGLKKRKPFWLFGKNKSR